MTKRFAVIDHTDKIHNVVISDDPLHIEGVWVDLTGMDSEPGIGWSYVDGAFTAPVIPEPAPEKPEPRIVTKVALLTRFTDDEFVGVLVEARTDAEVEAWYAKFNAATTIDLDDSRTKAGITMLYIKSLLSEERATAILTMPVQPNERP